MKKILLSTILIFTTILSVNSQSLKEPNFKELARIDKENSVSLEKFGFSSDTDIPESFSLEYFCLPGRQTGSSCTGYAVANGAMSILYNLVNETKRYTEMIVNRFDPFYVYCSLKDEDDLECVSGGGCDCGSSIWEALDLIKNYGCKKWYLYPDLECSATLNKTNLRNMTEMTGSYDIDGYASLIKYSDNGEKQAVDIDLIKKWLSYSNPIVAGIRVGSNFQSLKSPSNIKYSAPRGEEGWHAITIVGYDDKYDGGSFRMLNSYGREWGDEGFFWMSYREFQKEAFAAYAILNKEWDSWVENISTKNFYKGNYGGEKLKDWTWEGPVNSEGYFHGRGIVIAPDFTAVASYKDGTPHGWWRWYGDADDGIWGWVLFEDGEFVKSEDFGFSSAANGESLEDVIQKLSSENMDIKSNNDVLDENDFTDKMMKNIQQKSSRGIF